MNAVILAVLECYNMNVVVEENRSFHTESKSLLSASPPDESDPSD